MFKTKNHVGRPSNEEVKLKKLKKILLIGGPIILLLLLIIVISTGNLENLMGNSVTGNYSCDDGYTLNGTKCEKKIYKNITGDSNQDGIIDEVDLETLKSIVQSNTSNSVLLATDYEWANVYNIDDNITGSDYELLKLYIEGKRDSSILNTAINLSEYLENIGVCIPEYNSVNLNGKMVCEKIEVKDAIKREASSSLNTNNQTVVEKKEEKNNNVKPNNTSSLSNKVTGISLKRTSSTVYLNNKKKITIDAEVEANGSTDVKLFWKSSNENVAKVDQRGNVTVKKPGQVTITITTTDGKYSKDYTLTVKKKIVIVIGASQVKRMRIYPPEKETYQVQAKSDNTTAFSYKVNDSLFYIDASGSGIEYQIGLMKGETGANEDNVLATSVLSNILAAYKNFKPYVSFYVYFPMPGNTIKWFSCENKLSDISKVNMANIKKGYKLKSANEEDFIISENNKIIKEYASGYNDVVSDLKDKGYTVHGYVMGTHPIRQDQVTSSSKNQVVVNTHPYACAVGYRSNWKFYNFNKSMKKIVDANYRDNLSYLSMLVKFTNVSKNGKEEINDRYRFSVNKEYKTVDGFHWDESTTQMYVQTMLEYTGKLSE